MRSWVAPTSSRSWKRSRAIGGAPSLNVGHTCSSGAKVCRCVEDSVARKGSGRLLGRHSGGRGIAGVGADAGTPATGDIAPGRSASSIANRTNPRAAASSPTPPSKPSSARARDRSYRILTTLRSPLRAKLSVSDRRYAAGLGFVSGGITDFLGCQTGSSSFHPGLRRLGAAARGPHPPRFRCPPGRRRPP